MECLFLTLKSKIRGEPARLDPAQSRHYLPNHLKKVKTKNLKVLNNMNNCVKTEIAVCHFELDNSINLEVVAFLEQMDLCFYFHGSIEDLLPAHMQTVLHIYQSIY